MIKERQQQQADWADQNRVLTDEFQRKSDQVDIARTRLLATRKSLMLGRPANQYLAEQRRKVIRESCINLTS